MARAPSTNVKAPKRVHAKPRKEAAKSYIPFKARVLAAVYRISKSKQKRPRTASSQAIKKHLIARGSLHPSRYPQFKPQAFSKAKSGLESANIVYQPKHTLSFATTTETRMNMEDRLQNISEDDSADEQAAKALLSSPRGAPRATSTSPKKNKKVRVIKVDLSAESESDDAETVRVKKRSRVSGTKATKKPRQQSGTRSVKKPRRKVATASEGEEEEEEGTEVEVDDLELGLEENTIPAQTRRRRPTVKAKAVAPKPTKRTTATSKRAVAASADQPSSNLTNLRKAELVERVEELVNEKEEMRLAWEKERELVAILQEERDRLQQQKQVLAQGFHELREVNAELKLRLSQHEDITETEESLGHGQEDEMVEEEGLAVGFGGEGEGAMEDDLGGDDHFNLEFDDSGFGDVDGILKLKVDSREASMVPDSENEREPIQSSRILQRPIAPIAEEEGDDAHSFTSSYPELTVDSASRPRRRSRTPEVAGPQQESWASQHPPSPAASQDGAQDGIVPDEQARQDSFQLGGRGSFPTPDPSSPLKLGNHTVHRPRQDHQDDEESILSPTVIDEDVEEEEVQLQTVVESAEAYRVTIARLEREVEEAKVDLNETVSSKQLLKDELELVTRRHQDEVQSTTATLGRVNEEAEGLQKQIDSLQSHLEAARQSVGDERGRADLLETELNDANLALATARDTTTENMKEVDQLSARATAAQDRVGALEGQLAMRAEELAVAQTRITDLETLLEQLKGAHAELAKSDKARQDALANVNLKVFELTAEVESLKKIEERVLVEKAALEERAASLEVAVAESEQQLEVASKALADQQHRSVTLQNELDVISRRHQDQLESFTAELEAAASAEVEMQQTITELEVQVSSTEAQVEKERKHVEELQQALEVAQSAQQQMESEHSSTLTDLTASLDDSKKDLANARSARDLALAEKAAVQEQLSTARQQLDEAHQLLDQGLRRSEALKVELDLVAQRHRDVDEAHALQVKNMSDNLSNAEQTIATLEKDLADRKSRAEQFEEEASVATSRYAELVAAHQAAQEALAESTSKIDNLRGELDSTAAARDNFEAQATACQSDRLSLQQQLAFVQRQLESTSKEQEDRVTSLNAKIEDMARAFQGQREEAAKELAIAHKERAEVETTAATLQEEVEVIHKALVEEQHKAEQLDNRLSGVTESFNALALEKESLRTAISNAQKEVESMSARTEGLGADVEHTRAEKATLAGHNLMLEQDLAAARGQATTCSNAHAEEKRVVESLRVELATEVEARQSILLDLHQAQERAASLQTSYEVVCTAEAELRASLRSLVTSRGIVPPSSILSSSSNDTPLAYSAALTHHLADLDDQISVLSSSLHSAQALSQQISNAIPDHLVEPIHPDVEDSQETVALERSLKKVLDRVALLAEAVESSSAEDEAKHVAHTMSTSTYSTSAEVHRLEKILETLKSELLQLAAIVGPEAAEQELGSDAASPAFEGLPFLGEKMKTQALEVEHVDEEKKGEIGRLKAELVEEAAKRSRAVLKLGEKTKECVQLEEGIAALKVKHERALSAVKQASEALEG